MDCLQIYYVVCVFAKKAKNKVQKVLIYRVSKLLVSQDAMLCLYITKYQEHTMIF